MELIRKIKNRIHDELYDDLKIINEYLSSQDYLAQFKSIGETLIDTYDQDGYPILSSTFDSIISTLTSKESLLLRLPTMDSGPADRMYREIDELITMRTGCKFNSPLTSIYSIKRKYIRAYSDESGNKIMVFLHSAMTDADYIKLILTMIMLQLVQLQESPPLDVINTVSNILDRPADIDHDKVKQVIDALLSLIPESWYQELMREKEAINQQAILDYLQRFKEELEKVTEINYDNEISHKKSQLDSLLMDLQRIQNKLKELQYKSYAAKHLNKEMHPMVSELLPELQSNSNIVGYRYEHVNSQAFAISFTFKSYLNSMDSLSNYIKGYLRTQNITGSNVRYVKTLAAIENGLLKLPMLATIKVVFINEDILKILEVKGSSVHFNRLGNGIQNTSDFGAVNAHHARFNCFSTGKSEITQSFNNDNYGYMVDAMVSSAGNVNFYDGTVMDVNRNNIKNYLINSTATVLVRDSEGWKEINVGGIDEIFNIDGQRIGEEPQTTSQESEEAGNHIPF